METESSEKRVAAESANNFLSAFESPREAVKELVERVNAEVRGGRDDYKSPEETSAKLFSKDLREGGYAEGDEPKPGELWEILELGEDAEGYEYADELADAAYYLVQLQEQQPDVGFSDDLAELAEAFHLSDQDLLRFSAVKYRVRNEFGKDFRLEKGVMESFWNEQDFADGWSSDDVDFSAIERIAKRRI
jgi:hypothetical protein